MSASRSSLPFFSSKNPEMPSLTDWITALSSGANAVMAFLTFNGTYTPPFLRALANAPNSTSKNVDLKIARLEERVQTQATVIQELLEREDKIIDLFGDMADALDELLD